MTDSLGNTTRMGNDSLGRNITITDPAGNTTTQAYDSRDRLISYTDPMGQNPAAALAGVAAAGIVYGIQSL